MSTSARASPEQTIRGITPDYLESIERDGYNRSQGALHFSGGLDVTSDILYVEGRRVKIATGRSTQSVNISYANPEEGTYQFKYRISDPRSFLDADTLKLRAFASLEDFVAYLKSQGGVEEDVSGKGQSIPIAEPQKGWSDKVRQSVESAIGGCVLAFMQDPYLHRVEHSLHVEIYRRLIETHDFSSQFVCFEDCRAAIIQKEWPETFARQEKAGRGNFDLAILAPTSDITRAQFIGGYVRPAFVIEAGLNYGKDHLQGDFDKLRNSNIRDGYLLHFARPEGEPQDSVEDYIAQVEQQRLATSHTWPKIAYARLTSLGDWRVKMLEECQIESKEKS